MYFEGLALIYYTGHGAQINGQNYLLPVDMEIPHTEADVELSSLKVDDLVNSIQSTTKVVFLDACRDNPALFKYLVKGRGAIATGLAPTNASHLTRLKSGGGVFIAYATDSESVALEGDGEHSPFTKALVRNLKKPISIDDMFSLVTREVALVTKGMQRPYKYASLENIVCLTGSCSGATPQPAADIVQEARRSESNELQIALQTKNANALHSFVEKYPQSTEREKVLAEIARSKRSEFDEWTLFQIGNGRFPQYLKVSSIQLFSDRVGVQARAPVDPTISPTYPEDSFSENTLVFDCKKSIQVISEIRIVTPSRAVLAHYKLADPEVLDFSKGGVIPPGSIAATAKNIVCDEDARTPLVTKSQLAALNSADATEEQLAPMNFFELKRDKSVTTYYQSVQTKGASPLEKDAIVVMIPEVELNIADSSFGRGLSLELGTYKTNVGLVRIQCEGKKYTMLKTELYDASNDLKYIGAADLAQQSSWSEFRDDAPLSSLQRIVCGPRQVQK
jgi:hypothetical protein